LGLRPVSVVEIIAVPFAAGGPGLVIGRRGVFIGSIDIHRQMTS
jgi:hypothetical protein